MTKYSSILLQLLKTINVEKLFKQFKFYKNDGGRVWVTFVEFLSNSFHSTNNEFFCPFKLLMVVVINHKKERKLLTIGKKVVWRKNRKSDEEKLMVF